MSSRTLIPFFSLILLGACAHHKHRHHGHHEQGAGAHHVKDQSIRTCPHARAEGHVCPHAEQGKECSCPHHTQSQSTGKFRHGDAHGCAHHNSYHGSDHQSGGHQHRFDNVEKWAAKFEDSKRDAWQMPERVIQELKLRKGQRVADIGSATGYFPVRLAKTVSDGRVWGIDIEPNMVAFLNERARKEGLDNLFSVLGSAGDPLLPEKVDLILIVDTYHHLGNRSQYLSQAQRLSQTQRAHRHH